ncbi:MAG TPA: hypothetical protein VJ953_01585 [Saprospiraceae bacterium]|nr:hypothetical protein [Saprospiraceae bacterium]
MRQQEMTAMPVKQIEATVIVGLLSKKCKGKGICSIILGSPEIHQKQCTYVPVLLSLVDGRLLLSFQKNQVKKCTRRKLFSHPFFVIGEAYLLPPEISRLLSINTYLIEPGQYQIEEKTHYWNIKL